MPLAPISYPSMPEDTLRSATLLYGRGNVYIRLGDQLEELLLGLDLMDLKPCKAEGKSLVDNIQCAMLTIFQYEEQLPNRLMVEALRQRAELKYALHLPLNCPHLDEAALCNFRRHLFVEPASLLAFQSLVERMQVLGLLTVQEEQPLDVDRILTTVCSLNRFDEIQEAMYKVLEALAISDPVFLRQIANPYWYDRYNRRRSLPHIAFNDQRWQARALQIGRDIGYLLDEIDKSDNPELAVLQEIKEIRHHWDEQYIINTNKQSQSQVYEWRFSHCASCMLASGWTKQ